MTESRTSRAGWTAAGVIAVTLPCRLCGYDLRGLSKSGKCPECGNEILPSLGVWLIRTKTAPDDRSATGADSTEPVIP